MSYIGSTPTTQSFIAGTDYFNGTGAQINFTLSRSVNSVNDIEVIVNNVEQIPSGYSVSGTTLTFSAAPSAGTSNVYVRYLSTTNLSLAIPAGTSASFNTLAYTGTLTGGTGVVNLGSGQVYKDASGNVGIGTSSPDFKVDVEGSGGVTARIKSTSGTTGNFAQLILDSNNSFSGTGQAYVRGVSTASGNSNTALTFGVNQSGFGSPFEAARIDASGNLGIGMTPTNFGNGYTVLQVANASNGGMLYLTNTANEGGRIYGNGAGLTYDAFSATYHAFNTNGSERARIDSSGNFLFNSGYGSVATAYGCRVWVRFNGSGAVSINGSGNVSSITDNGTGDYTVNFTTALPDANYSVQVAADLTVSFADSGTKPTSLATGSVRVQHFENNSFTDSPIVTVAVFR